MGKMKKKIQLFLFTKEKRLNVLIFIFTAADSDLPGIFKY